ncbi:MAG: hypothetical protein AAFV80_01755 [Bacteroidota bacterium]
MLLDWLNKEFERLGQNTGLSFEAKPRKTKAARREFYHYSDEVLPELSGSYKELPIRVQVVNNPGLSKKDIEIHKLDMTIDLPLPNPKNYTLVLYPEGAFSGLGKLFGTQDIKIGDVDFDSKYMIQSNVPDFAKQVLNLSFQRALLKQSKHFNSRIEYGDLSIKKVKKEKVSRKGKPKDVLDYELTLQPDNAPELVSEVSETKPEQHQLRLVHTGFLMTNPILEKRLVQFLDVMNLLGKNIKAFE